MKMNKQMTRVLRRTGRIASTLAIVFTGVTVQAATQCYSFDNLEVGKEFGVGDSKQFDKVLVNFFPYYDEDLQQVVDDNLAIVENNGLIGTPPVLILKRKILVQVIPNQRVRRVTFDYAENTGAANSQIVNLGINEDIKSWRGTLVERDGEKLGHRGQGGLVSIRVTQQPHPNGGYWVEGNVTLESDPANPNLQNRGIDRFALGRSSQLIIDNVCLETF